MITNVLVDAHIFDGKPQGTVSYLKGLYKNLIPMATGEFHFFMIAQNIDNLKSVFGEHPNVTYLKLRSANKFVRLIFEIPFLIRKYRIEFAHYQYISPFRKSCREIVTIHDILFLDFPNYFPKTYYLKNKFFFKRSALRADLLLTVSSYSQAAISKHYEIPLSRISITPNGIEYDQVLENKPSLDVKSKYNLRNYLLFVSRFEPRKNHLGLLKAYVELELYKHGYDLVLVGSQDLEVLGYKDYFNGLSEEIRSHIRMYSNVGEEDLRAFYRECSLFVFPSLAEGFGIPPLEAYVRGCNCLCSETTAMKDFKFFSGSFFDPENIEQLKSLIEERLNNPVYPSLEEQMKVVKEYSWMQIAADYLILLRGLIAVPLKSKIVL